MTSPDPFLAKVSGFVLQRGGERVVEINQTTKDAVVEAIRRTIEDAKVLGDDGLMKLPSIPDLAAQLTESVGNLTVWDEARAERIARTETMFAYNDAALGSYREVGIDQVQAIDGDEDEECADRDGQIFDLDEALDIIDHPNGTLDWLPVTGTQEEAQADFATQGAADEAVVAESVAADEVASVTAGAVEDPTELLSFERGIMEKAPKNEYGQIFNADGTAYTEAKRGGTSSIKWFRSSPNEWDGKTLTHFHPPTPGRVVGEDFVSLSIQDVRTALNTKLGSMRAFSVDGRYMEIVNTGYRYNGDRAGELFNRLWKQKQRENWWGKPVNRDEGPARIAEMQDAWNKAYKETLIEVIERLDGVEIREGRL